MCPLVVPADSDDSSITHLLLLLSLFCIISLVLILLFFTSKPPSPPSRSAQIQESNSEENVEMYKLTHVLPKLVKDVAYLNLCISFGIVVGTFYALSTLLNQMLDDLKYSDSTTVLVGTLMVVVGLLGAILFGILADKTKKYKLLLILCVLGTFVSMVYWTFTFKQDQTILICMGSSFLGFFMTALLPICMDISVEITFPLPEAIVSNLLLASAQVFGILFICICTPLLAYVSIKAVNFTLLLATALSAVLILFFNGKNKREQVDHLPSLQTNTSGECVKL